MADPQRPPLLNLDTIVEQPLVVIDGQPYPMLTEDDLSIVAVHRLRKQGQELQRLLDAAAADQSDELDDQVKTLLAVMCRKLVQAPDDVHAKLKENHRLLIIEAFSKLLRSSRPAAGATDQEPVRGAVTGASSPLGSSVSMAATP